MSSSSQYSAQDFISSKEELQAVPLPRKFTEITAANKNIGSLADFCQGEQVFNVSVPRNTVWKPKQSFFRGKFRIRVKKQDGSWVQQKAAGIYVAVTGDGGGSGGDPAASTITKSLIFDGEDDEKDAENTKNFSFALAYNAVSTLFREFKVKLADNDLSRAVDVAHIDTICKRLHGYSVLNESFNAYMMPNWHRRHKLISSPVPDFEPESTRMILPWHPEHDDSLPGSSEFELLWRPHFGVLNEETLPAGEYKIEIVPQDADMIKSSFVQSLHNAVSDFDKTDYEVEILDFRYYVCTEESAAGPVANRQVILDYVDIRFQQKDVSTEYDSNISWDVPLGLQAAAIAFQSEQSYLGMHPFYSKTLLTVPYADPAVRGPPVNSIKLDNFYFDDQTGKTYPHRPFKGMGKQGAQHLGQIHMQNLIEQGNVLIEQPSETLADFYELGPYLYFQMELHDDRARTIQSNQSFTKLAAAGNWDALKVRALLFMFMRRKAVIKYNQSGYVSSVLTNDK